MNYMVFVTGSIDKDTTLMKVKVSAPTMEIAGEKAITHVIASLNYPLFDKYETSVRKI
jgi:hypothetical protein